MQDHRPRAWNDQDQGIMIKTMESEQDQDHGRKTRCRGTMRLFPHKIRLPQFVQASIGPASHTNTLSIKRHYDGRNNNR